MKSTLKFTFLLEIYPPSFTETWILHHCSLQFNKLLHEKPHVASNPGPTWQSQAWCCLAVASWWTRLEVKTGLSSPDQGDP